MQAVDAQNRGLRATFSHILNTKVTEVAQLSGGRNSRVFKVTCRGPRTFVGKFYFNHPSDPRDRLDAEVSALDFLWANGLKTIPKLVAVHRGLNCAVFDYIKGSKIPSEEVSSSDIDAAVGFLDRLKHIRFREGSKSLPFASEACFSIQAIVENIKDRSARFCSNSGRQEEGGALDQFVSGDLLPFFQELTSWCKSKVKDLGIPFHDAISEESKTLSPSDFGFHNTLRRTDGEIFFLDFEYFGWDDPAKMIADFLLHPGMILTSRLKGQFFENSIDKFGNSDTLRKRIQVVYPLLGIKWCFILLNEFVFEYYSRRCFSRGENGNGQDLFFRQLAKAKRMLQKVKTEYESFPYQN